MNISGKSKAENSAQNVEMPSGGFGVSPPEMSAPEQTESVSSECLPPLALYVPQPHALVIDPDAEVEV
jgi:hypothetical protein